MLFPNHSYDFQDSVYIITQGKGGLVQGIRQTGSPNQWLYQLTTTGFYWWAEDELAAACPKCFSPVARIDTQCQACGFSLVDGEMP
jgi:hypothetical protein